MFIISNNVTLDFYNNYELMTGRPHVWTRSVDNDMFCEPVVDMLWPRAHGHTLEFSSTTVSVALVYTSNISLTVLDLILIVLWLAFRYL